MALLAEWANVTRPVIGMIHLPPLPGAPRFAGSMSEASDSARRDADALAGAGVHGLMIENFGDVPFFLNRVPAYSVAAMSAIAADIRARFPDLPLGINVLRNDGRSALAIAAAVGASFIRVNVLCGARVADQGILQGIAHDVLRDRIMLGAGGVRIMADVDVKHSAPMAAIPIESEVEDTLRRGLADALIVSGTGTGKPTDVDHLRRAKTAAGGQAPVFIGSGVTAETIPKLALHADGFIVGTAFKQDGDPRNPVDPKRVAELISAME